MTNKEFVKKLHNLVNRPNTYNNHYPYNCCYYDGNYISADCYCLIKSIFWDENIDSNYTVGKFAKPNSKFPDYTIAQMMEICTYTSTDFSDLSIIPEGAILQYNGSGHAGVYIGNGQVIESTTKWDRGIQISSIDEKGNRSKTGISGGKWLKWGTLPQLEYVSEVADDNLSDESIETNNIIIEENKIAENDSFYGENKMSKEDWKDIFERTLYTVCEAFIGAIGGAALISEVNWPEVLSIVAISGLVTLVKCIMVKLK